MQDHLAKYLTIKVSYMVKRIGDDTLLNLTLASFDSHCVEY